ncbi:hypothetical protein [Propionibacterium australiense]|uniref:hypothetical protein n=1 Tax=Propionibacterium australiense TaxID=119981 RepID=UPI001476A8DA|nr:hypothetical protein [Propionibacterium australiense]
MIAGAGIAEVNRAVLDVGLEFSQIRAVGASLEDIFFRVTASSDQASSGTDDCAGPS